MPDSFFESTIVRSKDFISSMTRFWLQGNVWRCLKFQPLFPATIFVESFFMMCLKYQWHAQSNNDPKIGWKISSHLKPPWLPNISTRILNLVAVQAFRLNLTIASATKGLFLHLLTLLGFRAKVRPFLHAMEWGINSKFCLFALLALEHALDSLNCGDGCSFRNMLELSFSNLAILFWKHVWLLTAATDDELAMMFHLWHPRDHKQKLPPKRSSRQRCIDHAKDLRKRLAFSTDQRMCDEFGLQPYHQ